MDLPWSPSKNAGNNQRSICVFHGVPSPWKNLQEHELNFHILITKKLGANTIQVL